MPKRKAEQEAGAGSLSPRKRARFQRALVRPLAQLQQEICQKVWRGYFTTYVLPDLLSTTSDIRDHLDGYVTAFTEVGIAGYKLRMNEHAGCAYVHGLLWDIIDKDKKGPSLSSTL